MNSKRSLMGGIVAGIALNVMSFAFGFLPGKNEFYRQMFPGMISLIGMATMIGSLLLIGIFMGLIYGVINTSLPGKKLKKGAIYGLMVFLLAGTMWPIMMISFAPVYIWLSELIVGLVEFVIAGIIVSVIYHQ